MYSSPVVKTFNEQQLLELLPDSDLNYYLLGYLKDLHAKTILVEQVYIDKDYLIDYSLFYSRTFTKYERFCQRLHFFSIDFDDTSFIQKRYENDFHNTLQKSYLGFVVRKPDGIDTIGRTLLRPYPNGDIRKMGCCFNHTANIYGSKLCIESVPFQEQDGTVSACATIAVWTSLYCLNRLFNTMVYSPAEITHESGHQFGTICRTYGKEGLTALQICHFFKSLSLEVEYIDVSKLESTQLLKDIIYAYVKYGIPIIAVLRLIKTNEKDLHAAVIVGYRVNTELKNINIADNIDELYVHDDQIGPFSKVTFDNGDPSLWNNEWRSKYDNVIVQGLFIPLYHKIRLPIREVLEYVSDLREAWNFPKYEIFLESVNTYKEKILEENIELSDKNLILFTTMPHYFWVARCSLWNHGKIDFVFDATDTRLKTYVEHRYSCIE